MVEVNRQSLVLEGWTRWPDDPLLSPPPRSTYICRYLREGEKRQEREQKEEKEEKERERERKERGRRQRRTIGS